MRADPNAVPTIKRENKEAKAIVFLHQHKKSIIDALELRLDVSGSDDKTRELQGIIAGLKELLHA
jgi:hypothetical protein